MHCRRQHRGPLRGRATLGEAPVRDHVPGTCVSTAGTTRATLAVSRACCFHSTNTAGTARQLSYRRSQGASSRPRAFVKRGAVLPPVAASPACRLQLPRRSLALDADRGQRHPRPDLFHRGGLAGLNPCGDRPRHPLGQRHEVVREPEPLLRLEHRQEAPGPRASRHRPA